MTLDQFPYEIIYSFLLPLSYHSIMNFCLTNHRYYQIWKDVNFWATKAHSTIFKLIIDEFDIIKLRFPYQEFYETDLSPSLRYLELLALEGKNCERGSEQCVDVNYCVVLAAYRNNRALVEYFINKGATNLKLAIYYAAVNNNVPLVNYLLTIMRSNSELTPNILTEIIRGASIAGNRELVKELINDKLLTRSFITFTLREAISYACENGHIQLLDDLLNIKSAVNQNLNLPLFVASYSGNIKIIEYLILKCETLDFEEAFLWACFGGQLEVIKYLMNLDNFRYAIELFNRGLEICLMPQNIKNIKYILPCGPSKILNNIDIIMPTTKQLKTIVMKLTEKGRCQVMDYLKSKGATYDFK